VDIIRTAYYIHGRVSLTMGLTRCYKTERFFYIYICSFCTYNNNNGNIRIARLKQNSSGALNVLFLAQPRGFVDCIVFLYCTSWQNATYVTYK